MPDHFLRELVTRNRHLKLTALPEANIDHVLLLEVNPLSESIFQSMQAYFLQDPAPPESMLELKFRELVLSLLINPGNSRLLSHLHNLTRGGRPSLEEIMQENYSFHLSLADYARLACTSVPTFKREFRKVFKDSPARWVLKKKLCQAAELLSNSELSVSEISMECGFEDESHFSRTFRKGYGDSPSQWRRKKHVTERAIS
jgi:AraC family transcriptional regulator, exoenzyme S synthesis regulatory protein ExsA